MWKSIQSAIGVTPDGIPGAKTGAAIAERLNLPSGDWKSIQRAVGVSADGIPGEDTAMAIASKLRVRANTNPWFYLGRAIRSFSYEIISSESNPKRMTGAYSHR